MTITRSATFAVTAIALSAAASAAVPAAAATALPYAGVGQHATVMNNIHRAQRGNAAAVSHVRNNIRSTRPRIY